MRYNTKIVYKKPIAAILFSAIMVLSIFSGLALADKVRLPEKGVVLADKLDRSNEIPEDYILSSGTVSYNNANSISDYTLAESKGLKSTSVSYTIYATREGLVGHTTANGHVIQDRDHFVALPSTKALCSKDGHEYEVRLAYKGKTVTAPVWDVGPWNTKDDYWNPSSEREMWKDLPQGKPEAQAACQDGYNGGKDQFGRMVTNPAGIDLADGTFWDDLEMTDNDWVDVEFLWVTGSSTNDLPVPYIHQCWDTPNDFDGRHACGATSAVMILSYYNKLDPWPCDCSSPHEHVSNYGNYICKQYTYDDYTFDTMTRDASNNPAYGAYGYIHHNSSDPTDHRAWAWRMVDYFKKHGISDSLYRPKPSESDVKAEIDAGHPVIASTGLVGGHIVVIKGYTNDGYYIVNDPYGKAASGNYDGANVLYTWDYMGVGSRYIVTAHATPSLSLDLIFTIDTTGSMWDDIDYVKASASAIVDEIFSDIPTARIAVVDYRDFPVDPYGGTGDYPFNDVLSFSTDKSAIVAAIQGLTLGWGNDWRESVYSGLMHSIDSTSLGGWRGSDQAAKVIILMGDAPPHDPEPFTGYTLSSVVTAAYNADPVIIYPIQIGGTVEKFEELADQTGGVAFTAANAEEVVDAILEAIGEIKTKPVAVANGPYSGYVGSPITFDGTGSYDLDGTIVSYEWDLDDDGEFDDATGPTPSMTWAVPYSGTISLRVTDNDETTDTDSTTLTVEESGDTEQPIIEFMALDAYTTIPDATIHVTVGATDNVGVTSVTADSVALVETGSIWEGDITAPSTTGDYTLTIRAEDAAGNFNVTMVDYSVVKPHGSIGIGVDPRFTSVITGSIVSINIKLVSVENFDDIAYVYLTTAGVYSGYEANLTWCNWTSQYVKVPAGAVVNVPLEVSIPTGESGYKVFYAKLESTRWTPTAMDTGILYIT